jgi:hypothetical protein
MNPLRLIAAILAVETCTAALTEVEIDANGDVTEPKYEIQFNFDVRFLRVGWCSLTIRAALTWCMCLNPFYCR